MERIQKFLAHQGLASRRQVDDMVEQGRITVNGQLAKPGDQVEGHEKIALDGKIIRVSRVESRPKLLMYHKPIGEVCTRSDPQGRPTVYQNLPHLQRGRWVGIGRLDINTSGLILFTNEGELANRLMHPSFGVEREYAVRVHGAVSAESLQLLTEGVELDDGPAKFEQLVDAGGEGTNHWYHVVLKEGKNREVRRLWASVGVEVARLVRVRYDSFTLPKFLKPGKHRLLDDEVVKKLYQRLELVNKQDSGKRHGRSNRR